MIKHISIIFVASLLFSCEGNRSGMIDFSVPDRLSGQTDVLELACDPVDTVDIAVIGSEIDGIEAMRRLSKIEGVRIRAIFDNVSENLITAQSLLTESRMARADEYFGSGKWREICEREDIDLVYICTKEKQRTAIAVYAMECGKHVASLVPAALTLNECWELVNAAEKTRRHCIMIQNSSYERFELTTLNMAQFGFFGDVSRIESGGNNNTDAIAPASQILNIHRGDRMNYLLSVYGAGNTLIKTEKGKTIIIRTDSISALSSGRLYKISGKTAHARKNGKLKFWIDSYGQKCLPDEVSGSLLNKYVHPIVNGIKDLDLVADYRLVYCLRNGLPLDQDVYDVAEWSAVAPLSAISAKHNGRAVEFPDFTRGLWDKTKGYKQYKNGK